MANLLLFIFLCSALVVFTLAAYPLIAYMRALIVKKPIDRSASFTPPVSIIIAAFNEEQVIRDKINFFLSEEEWIPGSELIVISAGSTDHTNTILAEFDSHPHFKSIIIKEHLAKQLAVNRAVSQSKNDLLIFSDCRQIIKSKAVKTLVTYFNDPEIGVVNSTINDKTKNGKTSFIRAALNSICINESISGSSLTIHGALYAQRKSLFVNFPGDILFDDLFAVVSTIGQKKRLIQTKEVIITDLSFERYYTKNRLERLSRGLLIFLFRYWKDIKKLPKTTLIRFLLYRYLKLLIPYLLLGILIPSVCYLYPLLDRDHLIIIAIFTIILFSYKPLRNLILLYIKINYYFMSATFKYLFLNKRHTDWEKLSSEQMRELSSRIT
jgi:cellulose synthase/poly-beta-1,6-N-acetylglucosamine synthase-like glycosyltransferase